MFKLPFGLKKCIIYIWTKLLHFGKTINLFSSFSLYKSFSARSGAEILKNEEYIFCFFLPFYRKISCSKFDQIFLIWFLRIPIYLSINKVLLHWNAKVFQLCIEGILLVRDIWKVYTMLSFRGKTYKGYQRTSVLRN